MKKETIGTVGLSWSQTIGGLLKPNAGESIEFVGGKAVIKKTKDGHITANGVEIDLVSSTHIGLDSKRVDIN